MAHRVWIAGLVLCLCSAVNAGGVSFLELVPTVPGPYRPGTAIEIDILFHNREGQDIDIRLAQLDFAATDAAVSIEDFSIDLGGLVDDSLYAHFPTDFASGDTIANVTYAGTVPVPGFILSVADGDVFSLGIARISLPDVGGTYVVSVTNPISPNINSGARIDYGFDSRVILHPTNGNLAGGVEVIVNPCVCPEPTMCGLLGVGSILMMCLRRRS